MLLLTVPGLFDNIFFCFTFFDLLTDCAVTLAAVLAGTETGVELADQLSETLGLRSNGTKLSEERRNKYAMGEAVRAAGDDELANCLDVC